MPTLVAIILWLAVFAILYCIRIVVRNIKDGFFND
jgi:hypothetical protein